MRWIKEVFLNFKRSGLMSLISIGTITVTVTVLGAYFLMHLSLSAFIEKVEKKLEIVVFLQDNTAKDKADNLITEASSLAGVESIKYVTKWDAYQDFVKDSEMKLVMESFSENPLPDSLVVTMKSYNKDTARKIADYFRQKQGVEDVQYGADEIENLVNIMNLVKMIAMAAGIVFSLASVFVVSSIIKLTIYARRQDIYIFRMVGATEGYIRMPFVFEGIIHGVMGGLIGWGLVYAVVSALSFKIWQETGINLSAFFILKPEFMYAQFLAGCAGAGVLLGLTGSLVSQAGIDR